MAKHSTKVLITIKVIAVDTNSPFGVDVCTRSGFVLPRAAILPVSIGKLFRVMNIKSLKAHAQKFKIHTLTVYFAARDPNMPVFVRLLAIFVAALESYAYLKEVFIRLPCISSDYDM